MAALPYMPLFVADYLADTAHLTTAQHGAYLLLIMNYWQRGAPLPNDDARLAKIARMSRRDWDRNRNTICEFFTVEENMLCHPRIASELSRVASKSLKSKEAAQASVQRRFGVRSTGVEPTEAQAHTDKEEEVTADAALAFSGKIIRLTHADFASWQEAYPDIDLRANLRSRDDWLANDADERTRKRWFMATSNHLANLQQKARTARIEAEREAASWDCMP